MQPRIDREWRAIVILLLLIGGIACFANTLAGQAVPANSARLTWEMIDENPQSHMKRARIHGGWLVRFVTHGRLWRGGGITFVPDPDHAWQIKSSARD